MTTATLDLDPVQAAARERAFSMPLEQIDPSDTLLFAEDTIGHYFARLRRDAPVHRSHSPMFGDFWSVTTWEHIMAVDTNHQVFTSDWSNGCIAIQDRPLTERLRCSSRWIRRSTTCSGSR